MHRFYISLTAISGDSVSIKGEAAVRICRVLRLRPGALILIFDGSGTEWTVGLKTLSSSGVTGEIVSVRREEWNGPRIFIGQGIPKSLKMDFVVQKATELGVYGITPIEMKRSVVKVDKRAETGRISRWKKISVEASEQCGRTTLPVISPFMNVPEFCEMTRDAGLKILLWEGERRVMLRPYLEKNRVHPEKIAVVIGPEGGVDEKEVRVMEKAGFQAVGMGGHILRTETVALSILSIIQFYYGCIGGGNG